MTTTKAAGLGIIHKILMLFVIVNVIGDVGNVGLWLGVPSTRALSLNTGLIGTAAGVGNALIAGSVILLLVAAVCIVSLFGLSKKLMWAPLFIIAISVVNRALALRFTSSVLHSAFWAIWTVISSSLSSILISAK